MVPTFFGFVVFRQSQRALAGLTLAEVRWQPTLHTNHIAWLVWHMARVEDRWSSRVQQRPEVWTADGWAERFRMDPASHGSGQTMEEVRTMPALPLLDVRAYVEAVRTVTRHYLAHATDADLAWAYQHPRLGPLTGTWIVGHLLVEASQHVGQVALLRGMMRGCGT